VWQIIISIAVQVFETLGDTPATVGSWPKQHAVGQVLKVVKYITEVAFHRGFEGAE
jgi:hypothetical protein